MAHLPAGSAARFDFQKYIERSLEQDFTVVVGIRYSMSHFLFLFKPSLLIFCSNNLAQKLNI